MRSYLPSSSSRAPPTHGVGFFFNQPTLWRESCESCRLFRSAEAGRGSRQLIGRNKRRPSSGLPLFSTDGQTDHSAVPSRSFAAPETRRDPCSTAASQSNPEAMALYLAAPRTVCRSVSGIRILSIVMLNAVHTCVGLWIYFAAKSNRCRLTVTP